MNDFSFPFPIEAAAAVGAALSGFPIIRSAIETNAVAEADAVMQARRNAAVGIKTYASWPIPLGAIATAATARPGTTTRR